MTKTWHLPAAPRQLKHSTDLWVSLIIALLLGLAATSIALWPTAQRPNTPRCAPRMCPPQQLLFSRNGIQCNKDNSASKFPEDHGPGC